MHWLGAALVLAAIVCGLWIAYWRAEPGLHGDATLWRFSLHKTIGVTTGLYLLLRLAAMARGGFSPAGGRVVEVFAAGAAQGFMLVAVAFLSVSGVVQHMLVQGGAPVWLVPVDSVRDVLVGRGILPEADLRLAEILGRVHRVLAWGLIAAVFLHAGGAIKHRFVDGDGVFDRMAGRVGAGRRVPPASLRALEVRRNGLAVGAALAFVLAAWALANGGPPSGGPETAKPAGEAPVAVQSARGMRWIVDPQRSLLEIEAVQGGTPFTALFRSFDVEIEFDPAQPESARITARIAANSFFSGLSDRDAIVHGEDWLYAVRHPFVRWESRRVARTGDDVFLAEGELAIGASRAAVDVVFSLQVSGDTATADGHARFMRAAVGLGRGETGSPDAAGPEIKVRVRIHAHHAGP